MVTNNNLIVNTNKLNKNKVVVLDLDETLGYFVEFSIFWDCLSRYLHKIQHYELNKDDFIEIFDLYPEFLRPDIIHILKYLKKKKINKECSKIYIYTNNQGPSFWVKDIIYYFETKLKYKLIDQLISAFKINGKTVEVCRTTNNKTYKDFIKCSKLPENTEICFIDDNFFPDMTHDNVYYINIKPYIHNLSFSSIIHRFCKSNFFKEKMKDKEYCKKELKECLNNYSYSFTETIEKEKEIDKILSKQIMIHLRIFFEDNDYQTKKIRKIKINKTYKHH